MIRKAPESIFQGHQSIIYAQIHGQAQVRDQIQEQGFLEGIGNTPSFMFSTQGVVHLY